MRMYPEQRRVVFFFLALVGVGALSLGLVVLSLQLRHETESTLRRRLIGLDLPILQSAQEVSLHLSRLYRNLASPMGERPTGPQARTLTLEREVSNSLAMIGQALEAMARWHALHSEVDSAGPLRRAQERHRQLRDAVNTEPWAPEQLRDDLDALNLAITQVDRLISIDLDRVVEESLVQSQEIRNRTVIAVTSILVVSALLGGYLLLLLRRSLRAQVVTQELLMTRERELRQSQKLEAVGTLVGGVAHDFNNLLTVILAVAEDLQLDPKSAPSTRDGLQEIQTAAERAAGITRQLLAFSRLGEVQPRRVELNGLIQDVVPVLRRLLREDISLSLEVEGSIGSVFIDPVQIEQVLINLMVNARDAMPGGGRLRIWTSREEVGVNREFATDSPDAYARLSVQDTGSGMTEEVRDRVFEPFFTTKEVGQGTGLGLSSVHGIVTRNGGFVQVDSVPGRGTRFDVYLPLAEGDSSESDDETRDHDPLLVSETMLVVEDEGQVLDIVTKGLCQAGCQVLSATSGEEALRLCSEHEGPIHLVLTDVILPGLRGPELVQRIRELHPEIGVVYMSGYSEQTVVDPDGTIPPLVRKPFQLQELIRVVLHELGRVRAGSSQARHS